MSKIRNITEASALVGENTPEYVDIGGKLITVEEMTHAQFTELWGIIVDCIKAYQANGQTEVFAALMLQNGLDADSVMSKLASMQAEMVMTIMRVPGFAAKLVSLTTGLAEAEIDSLKYGDVLMLVGKAVKVNIVQNRGLLSFFGDMIAGVKVIAEAVEAAQKKE